MPNPISNSLRLMRAGLVLTYYGVALFPQTIQAPWPVKLGRFLLLPIRAVGALLRAPFKHKSTEQRLVEALTRLGPTYIKLGQFLATRPDIIGKELARDLSALQDRLPPFGQQQAEAEIARQLGKPASEVFIEFGPPIAAASIAQVHKARLKNGEKEQEVAVKILRPGIEQRFAKDQAAYRFAARVIEWLSKPARRLKPLEVVKTLDRTMAIELDLRLEAAALSELAENTKDDEKFRTPTPEWALTTQRVLTTEWINATPIANIETLQSQGHDLEALGTHVLQTFLRQAMRDGFFHADMHPGNLMVSSDGTLIALDCGIMGRLGAREQRFLAEILHGFVTRNYMAAARAHFEAGYVPPIHSVEEFAQGLRAIGEPIADRPATEISMARFLGQLFEYTSLYDMKTRPELILLQKNLVVAEGVARTLNPELNLWRAAEPVVKEWLTRELGPTAKLQKMTEGFKAIDRFLDNIPNHLRHLEEDLDGLSNLARIIRDMDEESLQRLLEGRRKPATQQSLAVWLIAISLITIAVFLYFTNS